MRIVLHGQQAFGKAVLEALLERGEDVVAVYAPPEGGREDPLAQAARDAGLPLVRPASFRGPEVLDEFRAFAPDLQVMAFVTLIVPADFLAAPTFGTIQYHPSLLPRHRGRSAINWPIIKGETETGLTVFWPDGGIDTGDILLQRTTPISEADTLGSVYFDRLFPLGVEALVEAVDMVRAGTAPRIPQDEALATYEAPCGRENARLDWGKPCRQLYDLVRGCDPAPGAWTTHAGRTLRVVAAAPQPARSVEGVGGAMGEVVDVGDDGFSVVCADGRLRVLRVRAEGGVKTGAGEWAAQSGLVPGARLE
ncbi:MAG: methionyl-tRNA formyltransferase [Actinobacteria bacterium]|nr:methionyl-tRNA formyltransferase [Actinomycetota bacterium]